MRRIYCADCGTTKPTPPEDAALGLVPRRTNGVLIRSLFCDCCDKPLHEGAVVWAESVPSDMRRWEDDYMLIAEFVYPQKEAST